MGSDRSRGEKRGLGVVLAPVAGLVTRHPRAVLIGWILLIAVLAWRGMGLEDELSTRPVYLDGTAAARAHSIAVNQFGGEDTQVVMLRGPRAAVDRQGSRLAHRLEARRGTLVISPWTSGGTIDGLQPRPGVAALLVNTAHQPGKSSLAAAPNIERELELTISAPVTVSLAGGQAIVDSLRESIKKATETGERVAIPVLLIVLLLVCRSLIAAAMPVVIGGTIAAASKGMLDLLHGFVHIDPFAVGIAAMLGLALGVDYSLLVVSRFRQESSGGDPAGAVRRTVVATGRSVIPAGAGLLLAMLVASQMLPGAVASIALAVIVVSILSVLSAMFVAPAMLMVSGRYLDRWSLPPRRDEGGSVMRWSRRISSRPPLVLAIVFGLMVCSAWAFTLETKTGSVTQLPASDPGRRQQEDIQRALGPGWVGPLEVVMNGRDQPVTTAHRLRALSDFQRRVEKDPGIATMAGFTSFEDSAQQLGGVEDGLARQQRGLSRIDRGVVRAHDGAGALGGGFLSAADGAAQLGSAAGSARAGSGELVAGLRDSSKGSEQLSGGLDNASEGSGNVASAASKASAGAGELAAKVAEAQEQAGETTSSAKVLENALLDGERALTGVEAPLESTEAELVSAWQSLQAMSSGRDDPQYAPALDAVAAAIRGLTGGDPGAEAAEASGGVGAGVDEAQGQFSLGLYLADQMAKRGKKTQSGVAELARSSARLDRGLQRLKRGSAQVSDGIGNLSGGSEDLAPGLQRLAAGAERVSGGLGQIEAGAESLVGGLGSGARRSNLLAGGLRRIHTGVDRQQGGPGGSQVDRLHEQAPGLFESGYFYLAGFDGTKPRRRDQAGLLVNLDRGGTAARMLVIPNDDPSTEAAEATTARLRLDAERLAGETNSEVVVGGWGPSLVDLDTALRDQGPTIRLVLSLVTVLVLLLVTRSLALALLAALLNLLTVSATFGLMALLFDGSLLGGPGFVDSSMIAASVTLVFGLAIDYEVFVFARIREEYLRTGSTATAIDNGLGRTAHVITGAALIMCAVFIAFSVSPLAALRNMGVGLAIATIIDAFVIRFVLVPAAMRLLGERSWWIPRWLDRLVPGSRSRVVAAEGEAAS